MINVKKRNGSTEPYNPQKIVEAVKKAQSRTDSLLKYLGEAIEREVSEKLPESVSVDAIHEQVENSLMRSGEFDVAREYITYRKSHMPSLFRERKEFRPFEYPDLYKFSEAIHKSFWTFRHFNYDSDVQDFKVKLTDHECTVVTRAMLAIGQVEVAVKTFWGKIGDYLPKPEIQAVGAVFSDSEVRHADAYTHLLEILGLNEEFKNIDQHKPLANRRDHLIKKLKPTDTKEEFMLKVLLFSTFVENVSLFSQFLIMQAFDKETNRMSGLANAIEATSKEEDIHFQFGVELIKTIKKEHPELWTDELIDQVVEEAQEALYAEFVLIDWMFEGEALSFITGEDVKQFTTKRMEDSLSAIGINWNSLIYTGGSKFDKWFEQERVVPMNTDFFAKKVTDYSKGTQSFTEDDLF